MSQPPSIEYVSAICHEHEGGHCWHPESDNGRTVVEVCCWCANRHFAVASHGSFTPTETVQA